MEFTNLIYEVQGGVAIIKLNRAEKLNALNESLWSELSGALDCAETDDKVRVVILTGAGEKAFCAGDDISILETLTTVPSIRTFQKRILPVFLKLEKLDKPVIAAVNGMAVGGGFELALASDITIASETATFSLPEGRLGVAPGYAVLRLSQAVSTKRARRLSLTCETIDAREAQRIGLVNQVVPAEKLLSAAKEEAKKIMTIAPLAVTVSKAMYNRFSGGEELEYIIETATMLFGTKDRQEGVKAFLEKRKPIFKGE